MLFVLHDKPIAFHFRSPASHIVDHAVTSIDGETTYIYCLSLNQPDFRDITERYYTISPFLRFGKYIIRYTGHTKRWELVIMNTDRWPHHTYNVISTHATLYDALVAVRQQRG